MVILHTVGIVVVVSDEWCTLQYTGAGAAAETVGMETLSHSLQHTVSDSLPTPRADGQGILTSKNKIKQGNSRMILNVLRI